LEDRSHLEQAVRYLYRLGYDNIRGFLRDGIESWYNAGLPVEELPLMTVHQLKARLESGDDIFVLDIRDQLEWNSGRIAGSTHIFAGHIAGRLNEIPRNKPVAVTCSVGHRGGVAASILLRAGFTSVYNVLGGTVAWRQAGFPLVNI
jgi:hydroxyacylglutathione hydrolase